MTASVVGMTDDLVCDSLLLRQELLQAYHGGDDESDLSDQEGLAGDEGNGTECKRDQGCSLQFQCEE